jgi:hypothetical protein
MVSFIKQIIMYVFFILTILVLGCGKPNSEPAVREGNKEAVEKIEIPKPNQERKHLLFLFDKSQSIDLNPTISQRLNNEIGKLVWENFDTIGSQVRGFYVHGNTLGIPACLKEKCNVEYPKGVNEFGEVKKKMEMLKFAKRVKSKTDKVLSQILDLITSENESETKIQTDLWATLQLIRDFREEVNGEPVTVVYLSDMNESMPGKDRRNFDRARERPQNRQQAKEFAAEDMVFIKNLYDVDGLKMDDVEVIILLPFDQMAGGEGFNEVKYYWEALFGEFGCEKVKGI